MYTSKEFQAATDARMHLAAIMTAIETAPDAAARKCLLDMMLLAVCDLSDKTVKLNNLISQHIVDAELS